MKAFRELRGYADWQHLRKLVLSEPREVLDQGPNTMRHADPALHPRITAVIASALRSTDQLDAALALLDSALESAQAHGDLWAVADILQRQAAARAYMGEAAKALKLARIATGVHAARGDAAGIGRATYDQGIYLAVADRPSEAVEALRSALHWLPSTEVDNRYSCYVALSRIHAQEDRPREALKWARSAARASEGVGELPLATSQELRGLLAFKLGDYTEAVAAFRKAAERYRSKGAFLECAFATVWLCRSLLEAGQVAEVETLAKASAKLIGHLRSSRFASGAIAELAAQAAAGRAITSRFLAGILERIEQAKEGAPQGAEHRQSF